MYWIQERDTGVLLYCVDEEKEENWDENACQTAETNWNHIIGVADN